MKFEHYTFDVSSYVERKIQPAFMLDLDEDKINYTDMKEQNGYSYYVMGDLTAKSKYSVKKISTGVLRIPIFAYSIHVPPTELSINSAMHAAGVETAIQFMAAIDISTKLINRIVIISGEQCDNIGYYNYRAYIGIAVEVLK